MGYIAFSTGEAVLRSYGPILPMKAAFLATLPWGKDDAFWRAEVQAQ
jgi:hypothetical protein